MKLVDANVCIAFLNGRDRALKRRFLAEADDLALCSVVKAELWFGAEASNRVEENLEQLDDFFDTLDSVPFDDGAARHYGRVRATLRRAGTPIGPNDLLIAAIALAHGAIVVTRNTAEFKRVSGLRLESW